MPTLLKLSTLLAVSHGTDSEICVAARAIEARVAELEEFARDIAENWDCDDDAHKYGTRCRACSALEILGIHKCETCNGEGTIDETLGGEGFSDPKATCPDCAGRCHR